MTFDEWWDSLTTRQQAQIPKETAKEVWVAATESENEACAKVAEQMPSVRITRWSGEESSRPATRKEIAESIRARMKP